MAEVFLRRRVPANDRIADPEPNVGFVFDDVTRRVIAIYGDNPTPDTIRYSLTVSGREFTLDLPPRTSTRQRVNFPTRFRLLETVVLKRLRGRGDARTHSEAILPYEREVIDRQFGTPHRGSPTVLGVTRSEVTSGTTHNMAYPATVDAGDLLAAWTSCHNGATMTATGFTQIGYSADNGFQAIEYSGKKAVGNEDGTTVNFATSTARR
jgi:hypothetical protein